MAIQADPLAEPPLQGAGGPLPTGARAAAKAWRLGFGCLPPTPAPPASSLVPKTLKRSCFALSGGGLVKECIQEQTWNPNEAMSYTICISMLHMFGRVSLKQIYFG